MEDQLAQSTEGVAKERDFHYSEHQKTKATLQETERELSELQSTFDKDQALNEGKIKFIESQRDQAKQDHADTQRKLEVALDQLQKRVNSDKEKAESSQNSMAAALEAKVREQLKEKSEMLNQLKTDSSE